MLFASSGIASAWLNRPSCTCVVFTFVLPGNNIFARSSGLLTWKFTAGACVGCRIQIPVPLVGRKNGLARKILPVDFGASRDGKETNMVGIGIARCLSGDTRLCLLHACLFHANLGCKGHAMTQS
jgi:hypothetical protein